MKILFWELASRHGGIESFLLTFQKDSTKNLFDNTYVTKSIESEYINCFKEYGGKIVDISEKCKFRSIFKVISLLKQDYDVIYFNKNSFANVIYIYLAKIINRKAILVIHSHNTAPTRDKWYLYWLHRINKPIVNSFIDIKLACSEVAYNWLFYKNDYDLEKIIPNGIIIDKFLFDIKMRNKIRNELMIADDDILVGNVGNFKKQKNHEYFINLAKNTKDRKIKYLLIGDGILFNEIKAKAIEENLNAILFLGNVENVCDYYNAMDIFMMPSFFEGLPIVALEAQTNGLKCLLSDTISRETKQIEDVTWFSLTTDYKEMVKQIVELHDEGHDRFKGYKIMQKSKFNSQNSVEYLEKILQRSIDEN